MANEEVLGPRKTMFVLVIVVGCFAVLWPRILSPLIMGPSREQLKPNQFDREAGCCEVLFDKDMAIMELLNEVCSSVTHTQKLSPYSAAECRRTVNETCGVDIAAYLKRSDNVGKTSKMLVETMKNSNSSCLREHFGVPVWSLGPHLIQNSLTQQYTLKQERPSVRGGASHPALRERGRAIPAGVPAPPARGPVAMPPHARVRTSPLSVYFELDIKPPPIPGMRPPLGSPGGPVPAPKSSMGFLMPIYTICIIVFFVYTLSKILFKRTGTSPYEPISPDPQFHRRVFRDDSRSSPDKLVVTAISGLVAEVQQQMEASYAQNQQRQEVQQDNHTRPYTNGTILHNSGPVHIVASEYQEPKDKVEQKEKDVSSTSEVVPETEKEVESHDIELENKETTPELEDSDEVIVDSSKQDKAEIITESSYDPLPVEEPAIDSEKEPNQDPKPITEEIRGNEDDEELQVIENIEEIEKIYDTDIENKIVEDEQETEPGVIEEEMVEEEIEEEDVEIRELDKAESESMKAKDAEINEKPEAIDAADTQIKETPLDVKVKKNGDIRKTEEFLHDETKAIVAEKSDKQSTPELLEYAIKDDDDDDQEKSSVKVVGMEITAHSADGGACVATQSSSPLPRPPVASAASPRVHEAESVQSIYLETEIPQQSRVLVADFVEDRADELPPTKHSPMVVSGKMTLSLIQDAPRDTPEREQESTIDEFTTASAVTQNAAEKEGEESDEEIEEEIEIEEIEEEVEEEEEEEEVPKQKETNKAQ